MPDNRISGVIILLLFIIVVVLLIIMGIMFYFSSGQGSDSNSDDSNTFTPGENIDTITSDTDLKNAIVAGKVIDIVGNRQNTITLPSKGSSDTVFSLKNLTKVPQVLKTKKDSIKNGKTTSKQTKINQNSIMKLKKIKAGWEVVSQKEFNVRDTHENHTDDCDEDVST